VATETSQHRKKQMLKRLKIVAAFLYSGESQICPTTRRGMIMDVVRCCRPDLRPLVPLDGGRFATSDLNDLSAGDQPEQPAPEADPAPGPGSHPAEREADAPGGGDALFDNGRRSKAIGAGASARSVALDMLKASRAGSARTSRKRVDYSAGR